MGDRETHRWTHSRGGQEAEVGTTILLLPSQLTPLLPPLQPTPKQPCSVAHPRGHGQELRVIGLGHMMGHGELTLATVSFLGSTGRERS